MLLKSIKIISFERDYEVISETIPNSNSNKCYSKLKLVTKKGLISPKQYVAAVYDFEMNKEIINKFYLLKTLKIFNLIQQVNFYQEDDRFILVYPLLDQYQINEGKLRNLNNEQKKQIILQLSITFLELIQRKAPINLTAVDQLYFIDGIVFINMIDYDYRHGATEISSLNCFISFIKKYFDQNEIEEIQGFDFRANTFNTLTESILHSYNLMQQHPLEAQYFNVFKYIFQIVNYKQLAALAANSHIYRFSKPSVLNKIIDFQITSEVIAKSSKIEGDNIEEIKTNVQREIELMELFEKEHRFAACYKYIRILDQSYLFMQYYCMNLREYYQLIQSQPVRYFNKLIFISGLRFLHMAGINHRDLKPENLFLTDEDITKGEIHIADFDRSKKTNQSNTTQIIRVDEYSDNTPEYSPPEGTEAVDHTIDIWQFGLIIYEAANMGIYPGRAVVIDFDRIYGPQVIESKLKEHEYDIEFLNIIKKCLRENPKERPLARDLEEPLKILYENELKKKPKGPKLFYSDSFKTSKIFQISQQRNAEQEVPQNDPDFNQ